MTFWNFFFPLSKYFILTLKSELFTHKINPVSASILISVVILGNSLSLYVMGHVGILVEMALARMTHKYRKQNPKKNSPYKIMR